MSPIPHFAGSDTARQADMADPAGSQITRVIADSAEISRMLTRIAHQILEANHGHANLVLLGIPSRGVPLARRLAAEIELIEGTPVRQGALDVTMYRDDLRRNPTREAGRSDVPGSIEDTVVVLVDDVLYSGRTVVAALDALRDLGRPRAVRLAVLVDRGHRELPIAADHVGKVVQTAADERVRVRVSGMDGEDCVLIDRGAIQ